MKEQKKSWGMVQVVGTCLASTQLQFKPQYHQKRTEWSDALTRSQLWGIAQQLRAQTMVNEARKIRFSLLKWCSHT
jgi:hypothetical protein